MSNAHTSTLVASRRHSLPRASSDVNRDTPETSNASTPRAQTRHGHRQTLSEVPTSSASGGPSMPVIVKRWTPTESRESVAGREEDIEVPPLPSVDDFSFEGILQGVGPKVQEAVGAVEDLCNQYQASVSAEVDSLLHTQASLDRRIKEADSVAVAVQRTTRARKDRFEREIEQLRDGAAVEAVAEATETTHTALSSILSTLLSIEALLPEGAALAPESSPHRDRYPRLHALLSAKSSELASCFSPHPRTPRPAARAHRRLSSASQHFLGGGFSESRDVIPPPQLQLKTLLPGSNLGPGSPGSEAGSECGYLPIAPQTATGVSMTAGSGMVSPREIGGRARRHSTWSRRLSGGSWFRGDEGAGRPVTRGSWKVGSWGGWSVWGGREMEEEEEEDEGEEDGAEEGAEERLRRVMEMGKRKGRRR